MSTPIIRVYELGVLRRPKTHVLIGYRPILDGIPIWSQGEILELFGPMENLNSMQSNNQVSADSPMTTVKIPQMKTNNF